MMSEYSRTSRSAEYEDAELLDDDGPPMNSTPAPNRLKKVGLVGALAACGVLVLLLRNGDSSGTTAGSSGDMTSVKTDGVIGFSTEHTSVLGGPLATCSKPGMALTGFTRDGHCADVGDDDAGSHHICIQMKPDFCTVTGQPNWCVEEMQCMGSAGLCPIGNWCVCQWAFARYLQMAGGCDHILDLQCDATNLAAFHAYESSPEPAHKAALACIKTKCGIA